MTVEFTRIVERTIAEHFGISPKITIRKQWQSFVEQPYDEQVKRELFRALHGIPQAKKNLRAFHSLNAMFHRATWRHPGSYQNPAFHSTQWPSIATSLFSSQWIQALNKAPFRYASWGIDYLSARLGYFQEVFIPLYSDLTIGMSVLKKLRTLFSGHKKKKYLKLITMIDKRFVSRHDRKMSHLWTKRIIRFLRDNPGVGELIQDIENLLETHLPRLMSRMIQPSHKELPLHHLTLTVPDGSEAVKDALLATIQTYLENFPAIHLLVSMRASTIPSFFVRLHSILERDAMKRLFFMPIQESSPSHTGVPLSEIPRYVQVIQEEDGGVVVETIDADYREHERFLNILLESLGYALSLLGDEDIDARQYVSRSNLMMIGVSEMLNHQPFWGDREQRMELMDLLSERFNRSIVTLGHSLFGESLNYLDRVVMPLPDGRVAFSDLVQGWNLMKAWSEDQIIQALETYKSQQNFHSLDPLEDLLRQLLLKDDDVMSFMDAMVQTFETSMQYEIKQLAIAGIDVVRIPAYPIPHGHLGLTYTHGRFHKNQLGEDIWMMPSYGELFDQPVLEVCRKEAIPGKVVQLRGMDVLIKHLRLGLNRLTVPFSEPSPFTAKSSSVFPSSFFYDHLSNPLSWNKLFLSHSLTDNEKTLIDEDVLLYFNQGQWPVLLDLTEQESFYQGLGYDDDSIPRIKDNSLHLIFIALAIDHYAQDMFQDQTIQAVHQTNQYWRHLFWIATELYLFQRLTSFGEVIFSVIDFCVDYQPEFVRNLKERVFSELPFQIDRSPLQGERDYLKLVDPIPDKITPSHTESVNLPINPIQDSLIFPSKDVNFTHKPSRSIFEKKMDTQEGALAHKLDLQVGDQKDMEDVDSILGEEIAQKEDKMRERWTSPKTNDKPLSTGLPTVELTGIISPLFRT